MITGEWGEAAATQVECWARDLLSRWYPDVAVASAWDPERDRCVLRLESGPNSRHEEVFLDARTLRTDGSEWRCAQPVIAAAWACRQEGVPAEADPPIDLQALGNVLAKVRGILETIQTAGPSSRTDS